MTLVRGSNEMALAYTAVVSAKLDLPADARLTDARIDSALATVSPSMEELVGEPPEHMPATSVRAVIRRDRDRTRVRIEGPDVVKAFLRRNPDRAALLWCYDSRRPRGDSMKTVQVIEVDRPQ